MNNIIANINLYDLALFENISVRTINICEFNGLTDINKIINYYYEYGNFLNLKNCGLKTNEELIKLCKKYTDTKQSKKKTEPKTEENPNNLIEIIDKLTSLQKAIINFHIAFQYRQLSYKTSNALYLKIANTINLESLKRYVFSNPMFNITDNRYIGKMTEYELNLFLKEIKNLIYNVSKYSQLDSKIGLLNSYFKLLFSNTKIEISKNYDINDFANGIPIFKTINLLIENDYIFNDKEKQIFKNTIAFYQNSKNITFKSICQNVALSRERIRQIRNNIFFKFEKYFSFISQFDIENINLYNLDTKRPILKTDNKYLKKISDTESVNFNLFFINRILSVLFKSSYTLVGDDTNQVLEARTNNSYTWISTYLVSKELCSIFDFDAMVKDCNIRLSEKINNEYSIEFNTYLLDFQKTNNLINKNEIALVAKQILNNEFGIEIDNKITFKRNTYISISEYAFEALTILDKPSKIDAIYNEVLKSHPNFKHEKISIINAIHRSDKFIIFGRTGIYALKNWENEKNIRGGTIRDIVYEYLQKHTGPKHITDITEFVNKYRKTNIHNVHYNIYSDNSGRFIKHPNRHIGLANTQNK